MERVWWSGVFFSDGWWPIDSTQLKVDYWHLWQGVSCEPLMHNPIISHAFPSVGAGPGCCQAVCRSSCPEAWRPFAWTHTTQMAQGLLAGPVYVVVHHAWESGTWTTLLICRPCSRQQLWCFFVGVWQSASGLVAATSSGFGGCWCVPMHCALCSARLAMHHVPAVSGAVLARRKGELEAMMTHRFGVDSSESSDASCALHAPPTVAAAFRFWVLTHWFGAPRLLQVVITFISTRTFVFRSLWAMLVPNLV
jgi:hypothetical protein